MKKNRLDMKGFTLAEIMIVVAIIGLLSAITIPNFIRSREQAIENTCLSNIRQLQGALDTAVLIDNASVANLSESDIETVVVPDYLKRMPDCQVGIYSTDADGIVSCSVHSSGGDNGGGPPPASPF